MTGSYHNHYRQDLRYIFSIVLSVFMWLMFTTSIFQSVKFLINVDDTKISYASESKKPQVLASFDSLNSYAFEIPSADEIFDKINKVRLESGFSPLVKNTVLAQLANERANDMVDRGYYAHQTPEGQFYFDKLDSQKYATGFSCENLDLSMSIYTNNYINDWLRSKDGHRECILNDKVTDAGYAVAKLDASVNNGETEYIIVAIHAEVN